MEALAGAASIAGILSLAVQGIQAINTLHEYYQDCTDEAAQQFLHELSVSARIFQDVKELCDRLKGHVSASGSQIRLASLQVQVEDCTADLQVWLKTAKRIDLRGGLLQQHSARLQHLRPNSTGSKRQFSTLFNTVLRKKNLIATKPARKAIQERFQTHQRNVQTALAILQTEFHLLETDQLLDLNVHTRELLGRSEVHRQGQDEILSEMRSSGSSMLGWSRSHDARLRDVQSLYSQLSDKLDTVLSSLSSKGSSVTSQVKELHDSDSYSFGELEEDPHRHNDRTYKSEHLNCDASDGDDLKDSFHSEAGEGQNPDLGALFKICEDFQSIAQQLFDPTLADYIIKAQEWQAFASRIKLLSILELDFRASQITFDASLTGQASRCASQLLSLRLRALVEYSEEKLMEADTLFGFGPAEVEIWQAITDAQAESEKKKLSLPGDTASTFKEKERLTRINEWLLEALYSNTYLAELHRTMLGKMRTISNTDTLQAHTQWQRQIVKFWFLDAAATSSGGSYAPSTLGTESDLTVTHATSVDDYNSDEGIGAINDASQESTGLLIKVDHPIIPMRVVEMLQEVNDLPPEGISESRILQAEQIITQYSLEPVAE